MKTILAPVDLSAAATRVADAACDLAPLVGGRVVLFHVVQPPPVVLSEVYAVDAGQLDELVAAAESAAETRLQKLAERCRGAGVPVEVVKLPGDPVHHILERSRQADFVVLGSHGHGAMYDLLVGSTTHGILRRAACPVVIIPPARGAPAGS